jgi:hypothetical protein
VCEAALCCGWVFVFLQTCRYRLCSGQAILINQAVQRKAKHTFQGLTLVFEVPLTLALLRCPGSCRLPPGIVPLADITQAQRVTGSCRPRCAAGPLSADALLAALNQCQALVLPQRPPLRLAPGSEVEPAPSRTLELRVSGDAAGSSERNASAGLLSTSGRAPEAGQASGRVEASEGGGRRVLTGATATTVLQPLPPLSASAAPSEAGGGAYWTPGKALFWAGIAVTRCDSLTVVVVWRSKSV